MEVNDRKKNKKRVRESSLYMIHCAKICLGEGGARTVSGGLRYLNLRFLVQGVGKGTEEELRGKWV